MKDRLMLALLLALAGDSLLRRSQALERLQAWRERTPEAAAPWPAPEELGSPM